MHTYTRSQPGYFSNKPVKIWEHVYVSLGPLAPKHKHLRSSTQMS